MAADGAASASGASGAQLTQVERVLGADFLSPTLGTAIFPDLLQRFLPAPLFDDRAVALEQSWERAWRAAQPRSPERFGASFDRLWSADAYAVPLLFLNSTVVETGQRAILSPLATGTATGTAAAGAGQRAAFADALPVGNLLGRAAAQRRRAPERTLHLPEPRGARGHGPARRRALGPAGRRRLLRQLRRGDRRGDRACRAARACGVGRHAADQRDRAAPAERAGQCRGRGRELERRARVARRDAVASAGAARHARRARGAGGGALRREHDRVPQVRLLSVAPCRVRAELPLGWMLSAQVRRDLQAQVLGCGGVGRACAAERIAALQSLLADGDAAPLEPLYDTPVRCARR
jgi:hypothetical protein